MKTKNPKQKNLSRVVIIGCGHVGSTSAYSLLINGAAEEIVLIDRDADKLNGETMDLQHAVPLARPVRIWAGDFTDTKDADIAVIAAGVGSRPGETRLDLLGRNIIVIREIVSELMKNGFQGIILMTTNPDDILAQVAWAESGLPTGKVIGSGTVLDTARLQVNLGGELGIEARSIHAYIIGEHGESEIATWHAARIGGTKINDFCENDCPDFDEILEDVRGAAPNIVRHKGYTSFAIASCVTRICEAILRDEHSILPVSAMTSGQYGIRDIYLSLPCVVGSLGVEKIIDIPLDEIELDGIRKSAEVLRKTLLKIEQKAESA